MEKKVLKPYIQDSTIEFIRNNIKPEDVDLFKGLCLIGKRYDDKDGYIIISIKNKSIREHHIIGFFIFGERMAGLQINHLNGIKSDNRPVNLEIVTASENIRHSFKTGLRKANRGNCSKLTETDIVEIRQKKRDGQTLAELGKEYGVVFQTISKICNYESWGHVPDNIDMADLDFDKFQALAQRTVNTTLSDYDEVASYILGLICETGEIGDEIKKQLYHGHEIDSEQIKDELSDVLWYMSNLARKYGLSMSEIAKHNIKKLEKRYPNGFEEERSRNR